MKILKHLSVAIIAIIAFSCDEDFLDRPPQSELTVGTFPETPEDARLAINGAYNSLRQWNLAAGGFPIFDIMSDECTKGTNPGDGASTAVFEDFSFDSFDGAFERYYKTLYQAVRRANLVIQETPKIQMDESLKSRYIAEARFLRAYYYSVLVRSFGGVPMVTTINPPVDLAREDAQVIWDEIVFPDLEYASENLPEKSEYAAADLGRVTRGGAKALAARLHLYLGNFSEAESLAMEVINSGQYDLEANFGDAFSSENEGGIESVWEVPALPLAFGNGGNQYANTWGIRGTPNRGWGFGRPAYPWIEKMQANDDPRLDASVIFLNEELGGVITEGEADTPDTTYNDSNEIIEIECYNQKVWHPGTNSQESFGHNRRLIRFADVLLMAAEALNENNKPAQALTELNKVRARARRGAAILPDITTTDKAELRQAIANERNYELAFEGLRYWDLVRTGRAAEVMGPLGYVEGKHELMPIPQSEVDISEGRIKQNPEY